MDGLTIAASLAEIAPRITGSTVRAIHQPERSQFSLTLFTPGEGDVKLLIDLREASVRITERTIDNPPTPSVFAMLLRKHLRGGRVTSLTQFGWDRAIALEVLRREGAEQSTYRLIAELVGSRGNLHLVREGLVERSLRPDRRNAPDQPYVGLPAQAKCDPGAVTSAQLEAWLADRSPEDALAENVEGIGRQTAADVAAARVGNDPALELSLRLRELLTYVRCPQPHVSEDGSKATFYPLPAPVRVTESFQQALDRDRLPVDRDDAQPPDALLPELKRAIRAKERTIEKLLDWLAASSQSDVLQLQADLVMTYASDIPRGRSSVALTHPADGAEVIVSLNPAWSAIENAQALYKQAKRIRRGHPHVHERLKRCREELHLLQAALAARERGEVVQSDTLLLLPSRRSQKAPQRKAVPFRRFEVNGYEIWMGKSASQNDALLRAASPNDVWMHARDVAGSHVVVRSRGTQVPDSVLEAAARLAARHSKGGSEPRVDVMVTRVKHVQKPKGAPPGLANVRLSDTLTVAPSEGEE
jgi:predicted ribosome quality control (RQC) complex YloA/Tae2 family protein